MIPESDPRIIQITARYGSQTNKTRNKILPINFLIIRVLPGYIPSEDFGEKELSLPLLAPKPAHFYLFILAYGPLLHVQNNLICCLLPDLLLPTYKGLCD